MTDATRLVTAELAQDFIGALARLRTARTVDPDHPVIPKLPHPVDCDVCTAERRLDLLIEQVQYLKPAG